MAEGQGSVVEEDHGADVQGVTGAPDPPFTEDIGLDAVLVCRALYVEVAGAERLLVLEVQVGPVVAQGCDQEARFVPDGDGEVAVAVGDALGKLLLDEVVELDACPGGRLAAQDVEGVDIQGLVSLLGQEGEVGAKQADAPVLVGFVVAEGIVAVVELFLHERFPAADFHVVDGTRFGTDQFVETQGVGLRFPDVGRSRAAEHDQGVGDDLGHAAQFVPTLIAAGLHVLEDVAGEYLPDPDLGLGVADGAERQVETARGGEDGPLSDETDVRDDLVRGKAVRSGLSRCGSGCRCTGGGGGDGSRSVRGTRRGRGLDGGGGTAIDILRLLSGLAAGQDEDAGEEDDGGQPEGFH